MRVRQGAAALVLLHEPSAYVHVVGASRARATMIESYDPDLLQTASVRFRRFFDELRETFIERDDVLTQFAMALLSRQHVLMTGPPGTAKSQMASLVLGRIIDESTGSPSLFSRQFTENTVHTDLVGPINFKTLMESGRTEHFTEDGMLGSVHAFLDEVFDGRDMLLRSTLNILHERELKHGSTVTKGRIECAFMTSNRYISELLDNARQTLLAFIDRISFISFIPRGFADASSLRAVVRRHGGRFGRHAPVEYLSVQDLDVLQDVVDSVYVPEALCDAVATLVELLDRELAEAQRADPNFQPTRYLSTRTAVNATAMLRVVAVLDKVFQRPGRALQAGPEDLATLRYTLLLSGMPAESIAARLERESDPRERRQLEIMRTEAEIFARCLRRLPKIPEQAAPRRLDLHALRLQTRRARAAGDSESLTTAVHTLLGATESGATDATDAAPLLRDAVAALSEQVLQEGLTPALDGDDPLARCVERVHALTDTLERASGVGRPLADWLRGRLHGLLDDALRHYPVMTAETINLLATGALQDGVSQQIERRLSNAESLYALRRRLRPRDHAAPRDAGDPWARALANLERELTLLWDEKFRLLASEMLAQASEATLPEVLRALSAVLVELNADARRLARLGRECGSCARSRAGASSRSCARPRPASTPAIAAR
ncbi:MAG: AAA family ATPase [Myxococcales bacterium]|nr:AAA family ATPase [Myxococcales bacterium]